MTTLASAAALTVFAISLALCVYVYFGYPALIWIVSRLRPRPVRKAATHPSVSFVLAVHNEEAIIEEKLRNTKSARYPRELIEIVVVSDGSSDATNELVRRHEGDRLVFVALERVGKVRALNEGAARAQGEILIFSDANSMLEPQSLERLVENFGDPEVGGVCGNQVYRLLSEGDTTKQGENLYWRYDKWQKRLESRIGSIFAADGSLYAIRRPLYRPVEDPAQADDIAISTRVVLQGQRLVFEPDAVTYEDVPVEGLAEFRRKVRVTHHSVRALLNLGRHLWCSGFYSLELVSHKLLRHFVPVFLGALLVSNGFLAFRHPFFGLTLMAQLLFYTLAVTGFVLRGCRLGALKLFTIPYFFCLANAAALFGLVSLVRGQRLVTWSPRTGGQPASGSRGTKEDDS